MKRTLFPCLFVFSVLSIALSHGAPPPEAPPEGEWTIETPSNTATPTPRYLGNIGCEGLAPDGTLGFTVDIYKLQGAQQVPGSLSSTGGTSTNGAWGATLDEPNGGWTPNNVAVWARIVLTSGGMEKDSVDIEIQ
jgi:hypothetical protein